PDSPPGEVPQTKTKTVVPSKWEYPLKWVGLVMMVVGALLLVSSGVSFVVVRNRSDSLSDKEIAAIYLANLVTQKHSDTEREIQHLEQRRAIEKATWLIVNALGSHTGLLLTFAGIVAFKYRRER